MVGGYYLNFELAKKHIEYKNMFLQKLQIIVLWCKPIKLVWLG